MGLQQPVFLDSTVSSNFASTGSVDWLIDLLEDPAVTPDVARELREGIAAGYDRLQPAVDAIGDGIRLHETPGTTIDAWADQLGERLDPGEAESAAYAAVERGTLGMISLPGSWQGKAARD